LRRSNGKIPLVLDLYSRLNLLMIDEPTPKQLQNIEELQKELRGLMKKRLDDINEETIGVFAKKIFTVRERIFEVIGLDTRIINSNR
jgi:hypothetical protein